MEFGGRRGVFPLLLLLLLLQKGFSQIDCSCQGREERTFQKDLCARGKGGKGGVCNAREGEWEKYAKGGRFLFVVGLNPSVRPTSLFRLNSSEMRRKKWWILSFLRNFRLSGTTRLSIKIPFLFGDKRSSGNDRKDTSKLGNKNVAQKILTIFLKQFNIWRTLSAWEISWFRWNGKGGCHKPFLRNSPICLVQIRPKQGGSKKNCCFFPPAFYDATSSQRRLSIRGGWEEGIPRIWTTLN